MTTTDLLARRKRLLGTGTPLFYQEAVNIVRGEGVWLFDPNGCRYLDMYNNVPCVGPLPSARRRGNAQAGEHAQRPQPLSARRRS